MAWSLCTLYTVSLQSPEIDFQAGLRVQAVASLNIARIRNATDLSGSFIIMTEQRTKTWRYDEA